MHPGQWQLQAAKAQLSELVGAALRGEPQRITRRGKDAVIVLSETAFLALKQSAKSESADFVAHLLAMPREKTSQSRKVSRTAENQVATSALRLRDIEL
jgi:antitoxin Phd